MRALVSSDHFFVALQLAPADRMIFQPCWYIYKKSGQQMRKVPTLNVTPKYS